MKLGGKGPHSFGPSRLASCRVTSPFAPTWRSQTIWPTLFTSAFSTHMSTLWSVFNATRERRARAILTPACSRRTAKAAASKLDAAEGRGRAATRPSKQTWNERCIHGRTRERQPYSPVTVGAYPRRLVVVCAVHIRAVVEGAVSREPYRSSAPLILEVPVKACERLVLRALVLHEQRTLLDTELLQVAETSKRDGAA